MSTHVRPAQTGDLTALCELSVAYRVFLGRPPQPELTRAFLRERLARGDAVLLVAFSADEMAGFAQMFPSFSSAHLGRIWRLDDLFVAPHARKRGIGRALLSACIEQARAGGATGLRLETQGTNTVAQALLVEQGWEPDEETCLYHYPLEPTP
ncbi:MAG: hypothetical protein KatS3mg126_1034 [Lysobacteraceae bacterium]|nr:MAG: hypothetical protein KatS3mg126_1034 [Xanthomonadaceae bacterium]